MTDHQTADNTHAPQKEAHQYQQCICGNPGFPHCVCGDIEPVFKHCAQQPTAVYPDMHTLWMKHSLEFPGGQRLMRLKDFDKALAEAELRERWQYWSSECAKLQQQAIAARAEGLEEIRSLLTNIAQILDVVKQEWGEAWSSWDQQQRDGITRALLESQTPSPKEP